MKLPLAGMSKFSPRGFCRVWLFVSFLIFSSLVLICPNFRTSLRVQEAEAAQVKAPDLVVNSLSNPPGNAVVGGSFSLTDTTANTGNARAEASTTRYRVSFDATITSTDPLLIGTRSVPRLAAGDSSSGAVTVTIPTSLAPGTYFLGACADDTAVVAESNETNNCRASTTTVAVSGAPTISALSPTSGPVGTSITITGANFSAAQGTSTVTFNGIAATPSSWSATSIVAPVPTSATTGSVVVTVGGVASNVVTFTVTPVSCDLAFIRAGAQVWQTNDIGNPNAPCDGKGWQFATYNSQGDITGFALDATVSPNAALSNPQCLPLSNWPVLCIRDNADSQSACFGLPFCSSSPGHGVVGNPACVQFTTDPNPGQTGNFSTVNYILDHPDQAFLCDVRPDCTNQVTVNAFTAQINPGLNVSIAGNILELLTSSGLTPGIAFRADVSIADGPIPISQIHIRYVQNLTGRTGALVYEPKPDLIASLAGGATLPLLDSSAAPPPLDNSYYSAGFDETNPDGPQRIVTAEDSPEVDPPITLTGPDRQLQSVDHTNTFTMFLGCTTDTSPTFRTLSTMDWAVHYTGTLNPGSPPTFTEGAGAGITAQPSVLGGGTPVQVAPIASDAVTFVNGPP